MRRLAEIYAQQFRVTLASFIQYRAQIVIWMMGHVLEPLVYLVVWSAVTAARNGAVGGFGRGDFAAYFIIMMLVNHCTYTWVMWEFEYRIRHGSLSFALLRPLHPIHTDIIDNLTSKIITLPMMIAAAVILVLLFRPVFSTTAWSAALFVPALFLAFLVRFMLEWTLALAAFWTTRVSAVNYAYYIMTLFLAGQAAPLSLLPGPVQTAASILPFRWIVSFPVEVAMGSLSPAEAAAGLGAQALWALLCFLLMRRIWKAGLKIYTAVGA